MAAKWEDRDQVSKVGGDEERAFGRKGSKRNVLEREGEETKSATLIYALYHKHNDDWSLTCN